MKGTAKHSRTILRTLMRTIFEFVVDRVRWTFAQYPGFLRRPVSELEIVTLVAQYNETVGKTLEGLVRDSLSRLNTTVERLQTEPESEPGNRIW